MSLLNANDKHINSLVCGEVVLLENILKNIRPRDENKHGKDEITKKSKVN